jgi:Secretion system C-terminal sorting domain
MIYQLRNFSLNYWTITCKVCDRVRPTNCVNAKYEFNVWPVYTKMASSTPATQKNTKHSISIYPNPSTGVFTVNFNNNLEDNNNIEIFNLLGQNVYKETVINEKDLKISLTHLPKGTYIVKIANGEENYNTKIIIE